MARERNLQAGECSRAEGAESWMLLRTCLPLVQAASGSSGCWSVEMKGFSGWTKPAQCGFRSAQAGLPVRLCHESPLGSGRERVGGGPQALAI